MQVAVATISGLPYVQPVRKLPPPPLCLIGLQQPSTCQEASVHCLLQEQMQQPHRQRPACSQGLQLHCFSPLSHGQLLGLPSKTATAHYRIPNTSVPRLVTFRRLLTDRSCMLHVQAGSAVPHSQAKHEQLMQPLITKFQATLYQPCMHQN